MNESEVIKKIHEIKEKLLKIKERLEESIEREKDIKETCYSDESN